MPNSEDVPAREPFVWHGVLDPSQLFDDVVVASHRFADAAKVGDWNAVFSLLDDPRQPVDINWWRPGGTAWFTVLHQAAWHGAPTQVAAKLIRRGALRSLTDSRGRTAYDIRLDKDGEAPGSKGVVAQQQKTFVLRERYLKPPPPSLTPEHIGALDRHLTGVTMGVSVVCCTTAAIRGRCCVTRPWRSFTRCQGNMCGSPCPACTGALTSHCGRTFSRCGVGAGLSAARARRMSSPPRERSSSMRDSFSPDDNASLLGLSRRPPLATPPCVG